MGCLRLPFDENARSNDGQFCEICVHCTAEIFSVCVPTKELISYGASMSVNLTDDDDDEWQC